MKVVILAGGLGTRLSEYTKLIPKPMVKVGGKPIIQRIINLYKKFGFKEFYIALGYKGMELECPSLANRSLFNIKRKSRPP